MAIDQHNKGEFALATSRLRFLFVAAKIWRHAGGTGVSYIDHFERCA
jgi:hypothetical protein